MQILRNTLAKNSSLFLNCQKVFILKCHPILCIYYFPATPDSGGSLSFKFLTLTSTFDLSLSSYRKLISKKQKNSLRFQFVCYKLIILSLKLFQYKTKTHLYIIIKMNHKPIEPHIEQCVNQVQKFVISPAFKQTVTTTYCNRKFGDYYYRIELQFCCNDAALNVDDINLRYKQYCLRLSNHHHVHCPTGHRLCRRTLAAKTRIWNEAMHSISKPKIL